MKAHKDVMLWINTNTSSIYLAPHFKVSPILWCHLEYKSKTQNWVSAGGSKNEEQVRNSQINTNL